MQSFDVVILGGGAAGLMCAIEAGRRGRRVAVLERAERIGKKVLISGGGRCNFTNLNVEQVSRENSFLLRATGDDDEFRAESLVVATGGLSIPKMGATGFGYDLARQFGLKIVEPRPALVPFTFSKDDAEHFCDLAGVSAEVVASLGAQHF